MKYLICALWLFAVSLVTLSQNKPENINGNGSLGKGTILGTVQDQKGGSPVEFANVIVCKNSDSSMVTGGLTNSKGKFIIDNIPYGGYFVKINFIGYAAKIIPDIVINSDKSYINLHTIDLETTATALDAVTITGQKDQVEYNLDKKVINVDKNILTAGGTALDIMQTIPSVEVDIEGNVSLRGSTNVTIFVDGRPSGLTSLDQMPAGMIEKVEIVTNPSARYDPDGMSGIINIVTKRKKENGYSIMATVNASTNGRYGGSLNFAYNIKKFGFYINADGRRNKMNSYYDSYRELYSNDTTTYYKQQSESQRKGYFGNIKLGADYFINERNTLSVFGEYNIRRFNPEDDADYFVYDYNNLLADYYNRLSKTSSSYGGYETGLDYKLTFNKKNQELTASIFYSSTPYENVADMTTTYYNPDLTPSAEPPWVQRNGNKNKNIRF
ncbi:MAG: carboxypeptidase regulatory-like domain-containing protein [Bacteroidales bacterium]